MCARMDAPGYAIRLANTLLVYFAGFLELIAICDGRSIIGRNQSRFYSGDFHKLTTALGLQGTTPFLAIVESRNKTVGSSNTESEAAISPALSPASDSMNGSVSNRSYVSPWSVPGNSDEKEFPLPLLVASPAVAVAIFIFICISYKWHSSQLDEQARKLAMKVSDSLCSPSICSPSASCVPCSPCRSTTSARTALTAHKPKRSNTRGTRQNLHPGDRARRPLLPPGRAHPDDELPSGSRDQRRLCSEQFVAATSLPSLAGGKRDSCLSTLSADQEVLKSASPRRHSTFVL